MLDKLLKHEFKATQRIVPWVYLVTFFMVITSLLARPLGIKWLSGLLLVLMILCGIATILMTYVIVFYGYYKNLYQAEGYLMHTLPVKPGQLLLSKVIVSFVWLLLSYLLLAAVVLTVAVLVTGESGVRLGDLLERVLMESGLSRASIGWLAGALAGYVCLSILYLMAQVFFAISLGNISRFHSLGAGAPILFYLCVYFLGQLGTLAFMVLVPAGLTISQGAVQFVSRGMLATLLNENDLVFGLGSIFFMLVATVGLFIWTKRLICNSTSLR
jgi:hypothetical protein